MSNNLCLLLDFRKQEGERLTKKKWLFPSVAASIFPLQHLPLLLNPCNPKHRIWTGKLTIYKMVFKLAYSSIWSKSSHYLKIWLISLYRNLNHQKERSWKSKCLLGVATVIIGLEMSNLVVGEQEMALAWDLPQQGVPSKSVRRWSDKRMCPPWHVNTLETIVPENLPRPSFPRRWEAVGFPDESPHHAAQLGATTITGPKKCFSLWSLVTVCNSLIGIIHVHSYIILE